MLNIFTFEGVGPSSLINVTHDQLETSIAAFRSLSLDADNQSYGYIVRSAVSESMTLLYRAMRVQTYANDVLSQGFCSEQKLYPFQSPEFLADVAGPLHTFVDAICKLRSLNPDLGGVGVSLTSPSRSCKVHE